MAQTRIYRIDVNHGENEIFAIGTTYSVRRFCKNYSKPDCKLTMMNYVCFGSKQCDEWLADEYKIFKMINCDSLIISNKIKKIIKEAD